MKSINKLLDWYFDRKSLPYWCIFLFDILIVFLSGIFSYWYFSNGRITLANALPLVRTLLIYLIFYAVSFRIFHTYSGIIRYSSFVDLQKVGFAMALATIVAFLFHYVMFRVPGDFIIRLGGNHIIATAFMATVILCAFRVLGKMIYDVAFVNESTVPALIYGVEDGGVALAKQVRNEEPSRFLLRGFLSYVSQYENHYLIGERVYTVDSNLLEVLQKLKIKALLVPPLKNKEFQNDQKIQDYLIDAGVDIFMSQGLMTDNITTKELKVVSIEDLLPRDEIQIDMESVGKLLKDKTILITGSAGSIGEEMVKQIAVYQPAHLILIDQAETPLHDVRLMMGSKWSNIKSETIVTSICKKERMEKIFREFRPDYVFHAAAYKHVPMMEDNPVESVQNNIYGTKVIADLSVKYGVKKFVMISTDKAVNPTNVMGCSKRICEIYVQSLDKAEKEGTIKGITQFVTTRFGNVLGSNGSVIPLFKKQIHEGGPVTVTDPNIIRYFMLIPEACKLVLEAGTKGRGGEIFVFDMGKPVKIADLAKRMIKLSGAVNVQIVYTGLRAGEKLYEEVLNDKEQTKPTFNPKIKIASVREYNYDDICKKIEGLIDTSETFDAMKIVAVMKEIVPEYKSQNSVYGVLDT